MKDEKKAPKLRFKGFTDDWEQCKLGDLADITTGSRNHQDSVTDGKYPFFVRSDKVERLNEYDFDTRAILVPGDGRIGEIFHYYNGKFALHQRVYKVDNFNGINALFLLSQFKYSFKKHALRLNAQGTVPSLRLPMFTNWNISIPNITEQERIGSFFRKLDQTITLHEEKKRQLERLKSALLQKMFADKSGYPPVRFEGFSDKWEQVKYGEIFQRRSKMGVSTPTLPSVEYDDINPGMGTLNKEPKSKGISKRGIYFNPGDVLFGKLRPYLKNWLFACFEGVAVGDFWVLTSSKIDHGFTYSLIQTPGFQYIANLSSGSKMPRSDWGLVSNARTFIPINHLEQERISSVLFGLDHAITLYEHKLEILNKIKSFLLQNMFI
ncbi:restriction endonuclease subunit S [Lactobacillus delbrueckii]|uniref:restriction endonuclease subunit S n=1 Tax=Lactobacillus delbrueckii TaxID=1584 RepID=UPI0025A22899|nr:restriction endonuclease subunit S [Lactobacillus delbrueckii]MDM7512175.1 restriction endonuclease subunit S [Lactobacillus delbrueckii]